MNLALYPTELPALGVFLGAPCGAVNRTWLWAPIGDHHHRAYAAVFDVPRDIPEFFPPGVAHQEMNAEGRLPGVRVSGGGEFLEEGDGGVGAVVRLGDVEAGVVEKRCGLVRRNQVAGRRGLGLGHGKDQRLVALLHEVVDAQRRAGLHDPGDLAIEAFPVGDVHGYMHGDDAVEGVVVEAHGKGVGHIEAYAGAEADPVGQDAGNVDVFRRQVDAVDRTAVARGDQPGRAADSATDIEKVLAGLRHQHGQGSL